MKGPVAIILFAIAATVIADDHVHQPPIGKYNGVRGDHFPHHFNGGYRPNAGVYHPQLAAYHPHAGAPYLTPGVNYFYPGYPGFPAGHPGNHQEFHHFARFPYHGSYGGKCAADGIYYQDAHSFTMCSNGIAYRQRCARGTANSGSHGFSSGQYYGYADFCDVNLNDHGHAKSTY